jgi:hypothetical protein
MRPLYEGNLALKIDRSDTDDDDQFQKKMSVSGTYHVRVAGDISSPSPVLTGWHTWADLDEEAAVYYGLGETEKYGMAYRIKPELFEVGALMMVEEAPEYTLARFSLTDLKNRYDWVESMIVPEQLGVGFAAEVPVEEGSLEYFLVERMLKIPEVESLYKYEDGDYTVFYTILSTMRYQRDVNMKVYEIEYMSLRAFPGATVAFRCIPRLGMTDEDFLPIGVVRLYKRPENQHYGQPSGTFDTSAA